MMMKDDDDHHDDDGKAMQSPTPSGDCFCVGRLHQCHLSQGTEKSCAFLSLHLLVLSFFFFPSPSPPLTGDDDYHDDDQGDDDDREDDDKEDDDDENYHRSLNITNAASWEMMPIVRIMIIRMMTGIITIIVASSALPMLPHKR